MVNRLYTRSQHHKIANPLLSDFIKELREKRHLNQTELNIKLGFTPGFIWRLEKNCELLSLRSAITFIKKLDLSAEEKRIFKELVIAQNVYLEDFLSA